MVIVATLLNLADEIRNNCEVVRSLEELKTKSCSEHDVFIYHSSTQESVLIEKRALYEEGSLAFHEYNQIEKCFSDLLGVFSCNSGAKCLFLSDDEKRNTVESAVRLFVSDTCQRYSFRMIDNVDNAILTDSAMFDYIISNEDSGFEATTGTALRVLGDTLSIVCQHDEDLNTCVQTCFDRVCHIVDTQEQAIEILKADREKAIDIIAEATSNSESLTQSLKALKERVASRASSGIEYYPKTTLDFEIQDHVMYIKCYSEVKGLPTFVNAYAKYLTDLHNMPCKVLYIFSSVSPILERYKLRKDFVYLNPKDMSVLSNNLDKTVFFTDVPISSLLQTFFRQSSFKNVVVVDLTLMSSAYMPSFLLQSNSSKFKCLYAFNSLIGALSMALNYDAKAVPTYADFLVDLKKGINFLSSYNNYSRQDDKVNAAKMRKQATNVFKKFIFCMPMSIPGELDLRAEQVVKDLINEYQTLYTAYNALFSKSSLGNKLKPYQCRTINSAYKVLMPYLDNYCLSSFFIPDLSASMLFEGPEKYQAPFIFTSDKVKEKRDNFFMSTYIEFELFIHFAELMGISLG